MPSKRASLAASAGFVEYRTVYRFVDSTWCRYNLKNKVQIQLQVIVRLRFHQTRKEEAVGRREIPLCD
jgi:hypothetical protein